MALILGIDPGSRITGYGVIEQRGNQLLYVDSGCIRTDADADLAQRLHTIFNGISEIIRLHCPQQTAIEQVFMARNADSALKLGQARGAAMVACTYQQLPVFEYSARQAKQAVVGNGNAEKQQVQAMICHLLQLTVTPQQDAADALGIAVCHSHTQQGLIRMAGAKKLRRGRMRL